MSWPGWDSGRSQLAGATGCGVNVRGTQFSVIRGEKNHQCRSDMKLKALCCKNEIVIPFPSMFYTLKMAKHGLDLGQKEIQYIFLVRTGFLSL